MRPLGHESLSYNSDAQVQKPKLNVEPNETHIVVEKQCSLTICFKAVKMSSNVKCAQTGTLSNTDEY